MSMLNRRRFTWVPCLIAGLVVIVLTGCGTSETTSTAAQSVSTGASAASTASTAASVPATAATGATSGTTSSTPSSTQVTPTTTSTSSTVTKEAAQPKAKPKTAKKPVQLTTEATVLTVPRKRLFSAEVRQRFLAACRAGKGSRALCECVLARQELQKGEREKSTAEAAILVIEVAQKGATVPKVLNHTVLLPKAIEQNTFTCKPLQT
jgi:mannitol-specific phosphotransferase system IIBC component